MNDVEIVFEPLVAIADSVVLARVAAGQAGMAFAVLAVAFGGIAVVERSAVSVLLFVGIGVVVVHAVGVAVATVIAVPDVVAVAPAPAASAVAAVVEARGDAGEQLEAAVLVFAFPPALSS